MAQSPHPEGGAARPPSPGGGPRGRCIALVCHTWGHASTFFSWTWTKQYLLRRMPDGRLDPSEQLFIVKARPLPPPCVLPCCPMPPRCDAKLSGPRCRAASRCRRLPGLQRLTAARRCPAWLQAGKDDAKDDRWKVGPAGLVGADG